MGMGPDVAIVPQTCFPAPSQKFPVTMETCDFSRYIKRRSGYKITKNLLKYTWLFLDDKSLLKLRLAFWQPEEKRCAQSTKILKTALEILTTRIGKRLYPDISKVIGCVATKELVDALRKYRNSGWNGTKRREKVKDNPAITNYVSEDVQQKFIAWDKNSQKLREFAKEGKLEDVKTELKNEGVWINGADEKGLTALHLAAAKGHAEVVEFLLKQEGIDVNTVDCTDMTALLLAAQNGRVEVVKIFLREEGIDRNAVDNQDRMNAFQWAAHGNHTDVVKILLLEEDIDVNVTASEGSTALHLAAFRGYEDLVRVLVDQEGIDINRTDDNKTTALEYAQLSNHVGVAKILCERGATVAITGPLKWCEKMIVKLNLVKIQAHGV